MLLFHYPSHHVLFVSLRVLFVSLRVLLSATMFFLSAITYFMSATMFFLSAIAYFMSAITFFLSATMFFLSATMFFLSATTFFLWDEEGPPAFCGNFQEAAGVGWLTQQGFDHWSKKKYFFSCGFVKCKWWAQNFTVWNLSLVTKNGCRVVVQHYRRAWIFFHHGGQES